MYRARTDYLVAPGDEKCEAIEAHSNHNGAGLVSHWAVRLASPIVEHKDQ